MRKYNSSVFIFSSQLFVKLDSSFETALGWYSKKDLPAFDYLVFPININNYHWFCIVIDQINKYLTVFESIEGCRNEFIDSITKYLASKFKSYNNSFDIDDFSKLYGFVRQQDKFSCGIYTIL